MRIIIIICILMINLQNCEQPKSNEDKMKSNYSEKPTKFIGDYLYLRMIGGKSAFGDPLCGGDPVGTLLGLNNDIPKPIYLEVGQTYNLEGNPNLVISQNAAQRDTNLFIADNNMNKNLKVTLTLVTNCSSSGISFGLYSCSNTKYLQADYTCTMSAGISPGFSPSTTGQYQSCTFNQSSQSFFIAISKNDCSYNFIIEEI